uniref:SHSP domain-containing protein n=2 Tax=fabids TaxID=91835 RepID=A0A2N9HA87_FAGSY
MDLRIMGLESPLLSTLQHMMELSDDSDKSSSSINAPTRTYVRDAKAMASTPADVKEYPNSYVFVVDMPGLKSGDIKVQVEDDNVLLISGERKREEEKEGAKYLRMERRVGKLMRKFVLPENANTDAISAVCQDGVLTVTINKLPPPEPKKPKTIQIIKFLLNCTKIEVNAQNSNGFTALDILFNGPRDIRDVEIKETLIKSGASRINEAPSSTYNPDIVEVSSLKQPLASQEIGAKQPVKKHKHVDWLGRKRNALMVVASLLGTVAFQAAISPPGGVWQDDYLVDSDGNTVEKPECGHGSHGLYRWRWLWAIYDL